MLLLHMFLFLLLALSGICALLVQTTLAYSFVYLQSPQLVAQVFLLAPALLVFLLLLVFVFLFSKTNCPLFCFSPIEGIMRGGVGNASSSYVSFSRNGSICPGIFFSEEKGAT